MLRPLLSLPAFLVTSALLAQAPGDTVQRLAVPSRWHFGLEAGGGIAHEDTGPGTNGSTVGAAYGCLGLADAPGTEIRVTGCVLGAEWVHDVNGADFRAAFVEPRFALAGSRRASRASWEGGILVQLGYGWQGQARDSLSPGDVTSTGFFWSPGLFVERVVPGGDGMPKWSFIGRIGGLTMASVGVARYF
jgi:hypothetical protein